MSQILPLQLRPKRLSELLGQKSLVAAIRNQMKEREPQAWMFQGPSGTGKTTIARILAVSYQCSHQQQFGEPCNACWGQWAQFTIHEINASEVNKVEDMAQVAEQGRYKPTPPSSKRVFILDESQRISSAGQNLLLKHFEEPAPSTIWMICTTEPNKILATLRRRCMTYTLNPLSMNNVEVFLKRYTQKLSIRVDMGELVDVVHEAGVNAPAMLLMILEKVQSGLTPRQAISGLSEDSASTLAICKAVADGDWNKLRSQLSRISIEEARLLRASVGGYLRGMLFKEANQKRQAVIASSIRELTSSDAPLDDPSLMLWLIGTLHGVCQRFDTKVPRA